MKKFQKVDNHFVHECGCVSTRKEQEIRITKGDRFHRPATIIQNRWVLTDPCEAHISRKKAKAARRADYIRWRDVKNEPLPKSYFPEPKMRVNAPNKLVGKPNFI